MSSLTQRITRSLAIGLALAASAPAFAALDFTVEASGVKKIAIADVQFTGNEGLPVDIAQIMDADFERSGQFATLSRAEMRERPAEPNQVNFNNWRSAGRESLVIGKLNRVPGSDRVGARFYLLDVIRNEQLLAFDMPPVPPAQLRYMAHQIADIVYQRLIGIPGIFDTRIAYVARSGVGPSLAYQLVVSDADGYNPRTIATSREPLMSPAWSPDRKRLLYVGYERGKQSVYMHELTTGQVRKLTAEKGINGAPAWSPDSRLVAVALSFEKDPDLYVIDMQTNQRRRLTNNDAIDTEPTFSPDGQTIMFTSDRGGAPQIYQVPVAGGDAKRVTFQGKQNLRPRYSPDGTKLALVNVEGSSYRIGLLDLKAGTMRLLSDGNMDEGPSFAPNGNVVIYATQTRQGAELATVTVDGQVRQRLTQPGQVQEPAWSPLTPR